MKKAASQVFLESAIRMAASIGIENLRTKQIAENAGFSEASLFRAFTSKEDVLRKAYLYLENKLLDNVSNEVKKLIKEGCSFSQASARAWHSLYRYMIGHPDEVQYLLRYRYSSLYGGETLDIKKFRDERIRFLYDAYVLEYGRGIPADKAYLFAYMLEITVSYAEKVILGRVKDTTDTEDCLKSILREVFRYIRE